MRSSSPNIPTQLYIMKYPDGLSLATEELLGTTGFNMKMVVGRTMIAKQVIILNSNKMKTEITRYKGNDLPDTFKREFSRHKKIIHDYFEAAGAVEAKWNMGFWYWSVFFLMSNGQVLYVFSDDYRWPRHDRFCIRTAKDFKDYTGGHNNHFNNLSELPEMIDKLYRP